MAFHSILFKKIEDSKIQETIEVPISFVDLNLDQIIDAITSSKPEYNLKPFFYTPLRDIDGIKYRQEIMRDLENKILFENIKSFAQKVYEMHENLVQQDKLTYKYQKESWFLDAVEIYCDGINCLANDLNLIDLKSCGFLSFREFINNYAQSKDFKSLLEEAKDLKYKLSTVKYCLHIKHNTIKVCKYDSEIDYSTEILTTFDKFKQGAAKDYKMKFPSLLNMDRVEAAILNIVALLYPDIFSELSSYCVKNCNYIDRTIDTYDREIQFYISYIEYVEQFEKKGLKFCYPKISDKCKEVYDYEGFDLALAKKCIMENTSIVCNDFYLMDKERIFVISGPNQGGKTTFARAFGQLHYLASIGLTVPGREAKLFLFDRLLTHFEKEENMKNLSGKLQDDLIRIHTILNQATPSSIIIMNEIFTSTTIKDAIFLGKKVLEEITKLDLLSICVTFIDELASLNEKTVSLVSTVVPEDPSLRTYKIVRSTADGLSYAVSIAEKYSLTYDCLKERITS